MYNCRQLLMFLASSSCTRNCNGRRCGVSSISSTKLLKLHGCSIFRWGIYNLFNKIRHTMQYCVTFCYVNYAFWYRSGNVVICEDLKLCRRFPGYAVRNFICNTDVMLVQHFSCNTCQCSGAIWWKVVNLCTVLSVAHEYHCHCSLGNTYMIHVYACSLVCGMQRNSFWQIHYTAERTICG